MKSAKTYYEPKVLGPNSCYSFDFAFAKRMFGTKRLLRTHWWELPKYFMKGILLASSGIDSTVLLYYLAAKNLLSEVLICDSGQASFKHQVKLLQAHCANVNVKLTAIKVPLPDYAIRQEINTAGFVPAKKENALNHFYNLHKDTQAQEAYRTGEFAWIEGRNARWFIEAGTYAVLNYGGNVRLFTGFQYDRAIWENEDDNMGGDVSPDFIDHMDKLFDLSFSKPVDVCAPFLSNKSDKADIVALGKKLAVPFDLTYSCEFYPPCGNCFQCEKARSLGLNQSTKIKAGKRG